MNDSHGSTKASNEPSKPGGLAGIVSQRRARLAAVWIAMWIVASLSCGPKSEPDLDLGSAVAEVWLDQAGLVRWDPEEAQGLSERRLDRRGSTARFASDALDSSRPGDSVSRPGCGASHANPVAFELPVIWGLSNSDAMTYVPAISIELQDGQVQQTIGRLDIGLNRYESLDGFGDPEALAELFTKHFGTSSVHEMGCALRVSGELPCSQFLPVLRATCDLINLRQFDSL
jgi:hypothetical protein